MNPDKFKHIYTKHAHACYIIGHPNTDHFSFYITLYQCHDIKNAILKAMIMNQSLTYMK